MILKNAVGRCLGAWSTDCIEFGIMNRKTRICTLNLWSGAAVPFVQPAVSPSHHRLAQAFSQNLQLVRNHRQDPHFGKSAEERIIWRELIDLELQEADEQIERISASAGSSSQP